MDTLKLNGEDAYFITVKENKIFLAKKEDKLFTVDETNNVIIEAIDSNKEVLAYFDNTLGLINKEEGKYAEEETTEG